MITVEKDPVLLISEFVAKIYADKEFPVGHFMENKESFTQRKSGELATTIRNFQQVFEKARVLFIERDIGGKAKHAMEKISDFAIKNRAKSVDDTVILPQEYYGDLFDIAMNVYDNEDYDATFIMMSAIMALYPNFIQPYIIIATITWKNQGFDAAISIYEQLTKSLRNPLLFCCAADCYLSSNDTYYRNIGKVLLEDALALAKGNDLDRENYKDLIIDMERMLNSTERS